MQKVFGLGFARILHVRTLERGFKTVKPQCFFFSALRRVLHLRMVTQCTMLDEFGLFVVLSDKVWNTALYLEVHDSNRVI